MKLDKVMWGIVLLFIGVVLLLENFGVIDFYWRSVWRFWPIFLIIAGVNILFNKSRSQVGAIVSIGILVITLCLLFIKGQERPGNQISRNQPLYDGHAESDSTSEEIDEQHLALPYLPHSSNAKKVVLNISGGGTSFELKGKTDSLISAAVYKTGGGFMLTKSEGRDSITNLELRMSGKSKWNTGGNEVDVLLNSNPIWEIQVNMGAGEVDFDLSNYKVREFNFDGGAAALDVKVGSFLPITDVNVKTGIADVKIAVPAASGCRITAKTGLSSKEFTGFTKLDNNTYETPDYKTAKNKVFIVFDGGLSSFQVNRY